MVSIKKNLEIWDSNEHWERGIFGDGVGLDDGEKWSKAWGSSYNQWKVTLWPRIEPLINGGTILELAPGRGRWTQFLKDRCEHLVLVDLSPNCIEYCRKKFVHAQNAITYFTNDGKTLVDVTSESVDFIFSFDSLVHVDRGDLISYLSEFKRVLTKGGAAFIHHSNLAEYKAGIKSNSHMRAEDVSGRIVEEAAKEYGLSVVSQELIPWTKDNVEENVYLDVFTVLRNNINAADYETKIIKNSRFLDEQF